MGKVLHVDVVHLCKVGHVVEEDVDLDNPLQAHIYFGEDGLDVLAALFRLVGDAAFNQIALLVGGNLTRDKDLGACDDGLGLEGVSANASCENTCVFARVCVG